MSPNTQIRPIPNRTTPDADDDRLPPSTIDLITTNNERFQTFDDLQIGRTIDDVEVVTKLETV